MFLPVASAAPSSKVTRRWVCGDSNPRICHKSYRLLQWSVGWRTEGADWQAAARNELGSTCHYKHTEVWLWSVARPTWNPTRVGRTRACHVQAMLVCLQVSAWNGTAISLGDVLADLVVAWPSASAFCCPWRTCRSSLQTYNSWQKGILFRWPVSLEQSPDVPEWSYTQSGLF